MRKEHVCSDKIKNFRINKYDLIILITAADIVKKKYMINHL